MMDPIVFLVNVCTVLGFLVGIITIVLDRLRKSRLRTLTRATLLVAQGKTWEGSFPLKLTRPLNYSEYRKLLSLFSSHLEKTKHVTIDAYVGVNVSGIGVAAELSNSGHYHPLLHMGVKVQTVNGAPHAYGVVPYFELSEFENKTVLVVDNSIRTGHTLKLVVDALTGANINVVTFVAYASRLSDGQQIEPDYLLMRATTRKPFEHWLA